ncbi:hypothetical protein IWQ60_002366 [Tieghemiomyces parasiticus]|uniref:Uncharacterized protein n=1 Tax=Tieghemiomyces parasiticus TaxID=78921 RepID=A0A9W8AJ67_9FUNG|nr:hypothetical protein IWQ60_002366 [Tieghemiomyces parasiticus]
MPVTLATPAASQSQTETNRPSPPSSGGEPATSGHQVRQRKATAAPPVSDILSPGPSAPATSGPLSKLYHTARLGIYRYEVTTGIYMLEPWEKSILNTILIIGLFFSGYTAYTYFPTYARHFASKVTEYTTI